MFCTLNEHHVVIQQIKVIYKHLSTNGKIFNTFVLFRNMEAISWYKHIFSWYANLHKNEYNVYFIEKWNGNILYLQVLISTSYLFHIKYIQKQVMNLNSITIKYISITKWICFDILVESVTTILRLRLIP